MDPDAPTVECRQRHWPPNTINKVHGWRRSTAAEHFEFEDVMSTAFRRPLESGRRPASDGLGIVPSPPKRVGVPCS
jgi:hypothetical protein